MPGGAPGGGSADNVVMCAADVHPDTGPDPRRALPRVDAVLAHPAVAGRAAELGRGPSVAPGRAPRRALPGVAAGLASPAVAGRAAERGRGPAVAAARAPLAAARDRTAEGHPAPGLDDVAALAADALGRRRAARTRAVVNA